MSFGPWSSFDDCVSDVQKHEGYDAETAKKVCGALEKRLGDTATKKTNAKPCCTKCARARVSASIVIPIEGEDGVERPAPGAAPTAFRIWKPGENPTTHGMTLFTKRSAELLLEEQSQRGNLYSIDVDHMSLSDDAPIENHAAVGYHRLAVRETPAGPELWAVDVEWDAAVKVGLEKKPPAWRYFSPAYDVMRETGEVTSYLNTALTINPATFQVTALASAAASGEKPMKMEDILAALKAFAEGKDEAQAKKAKAALAAMSDGDGDEEKKDAEEEAPPSSKKEGEEKKKDDAADGDDEEKKESKKDSAVSLAKVEKLVDRKLRTIADNAERDRLIASRKDLPEKFLASLKDKPLAYVKEALEALPVTKRDPAADTRIQATRGAEQGAERTPRLPPEEHRALMARMGRLPMKATVKREGNTMVFGVMEPDMTKKAKEA